MAVQPDRADRSVSACQSPLSLTAWPALVQAQVSPSTRSSRYSSVCIQRPSSVRSRPLPTSSKRYWVRAAGAEGTGAHRSGCRPPGMASVTSQDSIWAKTQAPGSSPGGPGRPEPGQSRSPALPGQVCAGGGEGQAFSGETGGCSACSKFRVCWRSFRPVMNPGATVQTAMGVYCSAAGLRGPGHRCQTPQVPWAEGRDSSGGHSRPTA